MNKVTLTGNLCLDVDLEQTTDGTSLLKNTLAVKRNFKSANGEYESDFINIVVWRQNAEYLCKYAKKGDLIEVAGTWQTRKYNDKDNIQRTANECKVDECRVLLNRSAPVEQPTKPTAAQIDDSDLPF